VELYRKIIFYKRCLQGLIFLNVFTVILGFFAGGFYLNNRWSIAEEIQLKKQKIEKINYLLQETDRLPSLNAQAKKEIQTESQKEKEQLSQEMQATQLKLMDVWAELFWIAALALVFGLLLPMYVFYVMLKNLNSARKEFEEKLGILIATWAKKLEGDGNKDELRNPIFWLEILLLGVELFSPRGGHPATAFASDLSRTIRKHL